MKKIKKFFRSPGVFARDWFNKRYPCINNEQRVTEADEQTLVAHTLKMAGIENALFGSSAPVDIVYTWVNGADEAWRRKYKACKEQQFQTAFGLLSQDDARFANHDELYYSLKSVEKYLPWVRKIYIVTDNQTPAWFDASAHPKVEIIDHTQIIDARYLPTFNSHVIEAHLHNIPGLSEQFIYFNDDVFVARELPQEHFFHANGIASIYISGKQISQMAQKGITTPTLNASRNSIRLIKQAYPAAAVDSPLVHTYVPLRKTVFQTAWQQYGEEITAFLPNKFRADTDLNMATFLVPWLMYLEGKAAPAWDICYYFNLRSANAPAQYRKLLQKKGTPDAPHSICANDFSSKNPIAGYRDRLADMLGKYYG